MKCGSSSGCTRIRIEEGVRTWAEVCHKEDMNYLSSVFCCVLLLWLQHSGDGKSAAAELLGVIGVVGSRARLPLERTGVG